MKTAITSVFLLALSLKKLAPGVEGATASFICQETPCVETTTESCEDIVLDFDFSTEGCCFSLKDDTSTGGCLITVDGNNALGGCSRSSRGNNCHVDVAETGTTIADVTCVGNSVLSYGFLDGSNSPTCPPSNYEVSKSSQDQSLFDLTMTLTGVTAWTEQDTADWIALTANHVVSFFADFPEYEIHDVISTIPQVWGNEGRAILLHSDAWDRGTLFYYQEISWRTDQAHDMTADQLMEQAFFNSAEGKQMYLSTLKKSSNPTLAAVTAFSGYANLGN